MLPMWVGMTFFFLLARRLTPETGRRPGGWLCSKRPLVTLQLILDGYNILAGKLLATSACQKQPKRCLTAAIR